MKCWWTFNWTTQIIEFKNFSCLSPSTINMNKLNKTFYRFENSKSWSEICSTFSLVAASSPANWEKVEQNNERVLDFHGGKKLAIEARNSQSRKNFHVRLFWGNWETWNSMLKIYFLRFLMEWKIAKQKQQFRHNYLNGKLHQHPPLWRHAVADIIWV